jgi:hypothetical protein
MLQIHATIPTSSKSLLEVREQLAVFMNNQEKLGVGPEGVSPAQVLQLLCFVAGLKPGSNIMSSNAM